MVQRVEVDVVPGVGEEAVHGCEVVAAGGDVVDVDLPVAHRPVGGPRQRVGHLLWGWPVACELDALAEEGRAAAQHCGYQRAEVCEGDLLQGALGRQRKRALAGGGDLCWVAEVLEEVPRCEDRVWDRGCAQPPLDGGLAVEVRHAGLAVACHRGEDQPRDLDFAGGGDERFALADLVTRPGGERRGDRVDDGGVVHRA